MRGGRSGMGGGSCGGIGRGGDMEVGSKRGGEGKGEGGGG